MRTNAMPIRAANATEPEQVGLAFQDDNSNITYVFQLNVKQAEALIDKIQKVLEVLKT